MSQERDLTQFYFSSGVAERPAHERQRSRTGVASCSPERPLRDGRIRKKHTDEHERKTEHAETLTGANAGRVLATAEKDKP